MGRHIKQPGEYIFELYEEQLIHMLAEGLRYHEMAERIKPIEDHSVNDYVRDIREKWGARNNPHLIHLWHEKRNKN